MLKEMSITKITVRFVLLSCFAAAALAGCTAQQAAPVNPATTPTQNTTVLAQIIAEPQSRISAEYRTYNDAGIFSISCPTDWNLDASSREANLKTARSIVNGAEGLTMEKEGMVFMAEKMTDNELVANANVMVAPLPAGITNANQMLDTNIPKFEKIFQEFRLISRAEISCGGRPAAIMDAEGMIAGRIKTRVVQMYVIVDKTIWTVTAGTRADNFAAVQKDLETIVKSLRINK